MKQTANKLTLVVVLVLILTTFQPAHALHQGYSVIDLGTLGGPFGYAFANNNRGDVIGTSVTAEEISHSFIWRNGTMTDLGSLTENGETEARGINNRGQVVGYSSADAGGAFLWEDDTITNLGTFPGGAISWANDINENGVIVGASDSASGEVHAFMFSRGTMTDLGTLGGANSDAMAINNKGQIVGTSETATGANHVFLWQKGVMIDIGTLDESSDYFPVAINNKGQILGYYGDTHTGSSHAFIWYKGVMKDLGSLGGDLTHPEDINEKGQIVGGSTTATGEHHAFLWERGVMTDLGTLPGGSHSAAIDINERGQIVGQSDDGIISMAVLWQKNKMFQLDTLGGSFTSANSINDHGQIAGQGGVEGNQESHAVVWTK
ncbi:MAG: HAF repeat-containing protein [Anaerolineales bacterium]|nr:HAF repeat-containing protein [Anaerolineales bacterium]